MLILNADFSKICWRHICVFRVEISGHWEYVWPCWEVKFNFNFIHWRNCNSHL